MGVFVCALGWPVSVLLVGAVRAYQVAVAPLLVGSCKFVPSCSAYFIGAVQQHGPWRGAWLGLRRLARCHPFSPGGYDPVPPVGLPPPQRGRTDETHDG
jgi:putative membrane protein insertion efficiency factor